MMRDKAEIKKEIEGTIEFVKSRTGVSDDLKATIVARGQCYLRALDGDVAAWSEILNVLEK